MCFCNNIFTQNAGAVFFSRYSPCMYPPPPPMFMYPPILGFRCCPMSDTALGFGLGFAAAAVAAPVLPNIFKGIGKAATAVWKHGIKPACKFVNEKVLQPIGKGISKVWKSVFHKKSKSADKAEKS